MLSEKSWNSAHERSYPVADPTRRPLPPLNWALLTVFIALQVADSLTVAIDIFEAKVDEGHRGPDQVGVAYIYFFVDACGTARPAVVVGVATGGQDAVLAGDQERVHALLDEAKAEV